MENKKKSHLQKILMLRHRKFEPGIFQVEYLCLSEKIDLVRLILLEGQEKRAIYLNDFWLISKIMLDLDDRLAYVLYLQLFFSVIMT